MGHVEIAEQRTKLRAHIHPSYLGVKATIYVFERHKCRAVNEQLFHTVLGDGGWFDGRMVVGVLKDYINCGIYRNISE